MNDSRYIVLILGILAAYCLYLGESEQAATCVGALAGVLTQSKGANHETTADSVNHPGV